MKKLLSLIAVVFMAGQLQAAEPVKIGMITTLSTKAGYLGEDIRDGFKLAISQEQGRVRNQGTGNGDTLLLSPG